MAPLNFNDVGEVILDNALSSEVKALKNTEIDRNYIMYYFNLTTKNINSMHPTHGRMMSKNLSYKRKFNSVQKQVLQDTRFINKKRKLEKK